METVVATQARLEAFIKDYCAQPGINQSVDLSPGSVLSELLIKLSAQLHNQLKTDAELPSNVSTIQAALNATTDTYSPAIDNVASNYNVIREAGILATGIVKMVVTFPRTYYVGNGFQLSQPSIGAIYTTTRSYRIDVTLSDNAAVGELRLYKEGTNGPYYFLLPVQSLDAAVNVSASHDAILGLNTTNTSLDGFIEARAFGNFSAGKAIETDRELISRFQAGLSTKGLMSQQSMQALLPETFPNIATRGAAHDAILSVIGSNDPELLRGKNSTYGITQFGLSDVYVRTSDTIETGEYETTATYSSSDSKWHVTLDSSLSNFPAWFYEILSVSYVDTNGVVQITYPIITDSSFTASALPANQLGGGNVSAANIARFTKYQVCSFTLSGNLPAGSDGDTLQIKVMVTYMPQIGEIQDYMLQSAHRIIAADYLVKAVIPCSLAMKLTLQQASSQTTSIPDIKQAIFNYINGLTFGESLVVSKIVDICHNFNVKRVDLPVVVNGTILLPTATAFTVSPISSSDLLSIPFTSELLQYGVSAKTTAFFADYQNALGQDTIGIQLN